ncbi:MAG TPA: ferredoxin [Actinobacteria bacterium]|nr:ferredoxin [Actinomycetota bacterium]
MLLVVIDEELCVGCGLCEETCPEVFEVWEDNVAHVITEDVEECEDLEGVAEDCPVGAITIKRN